MSRELGFLHLNPATGAYEPDVPTSAQEWIEMQGLDPNSAPARAALASGYFGQGNFDPSWAAYQNALYGPGAAERGMPPADNGGFLNSTIGDWAKGNVEAFQSPGFLATMGAAGAGNLAGYNGAAAEVGGNAIDPMGLETPGYIMGSPLPAGYDAAAAGLGMAGVASATAAGGAGATGGGLSAYQTGMLGLAGLSTLGGMVNASKKPSIPGASPTAGFAGGGTPLNPNNPVLDASVAKAAQDAAYANATSRLDPQWRQAGDMKETALRNQGLVPGTAAYDNAMRDFNFGKNDAYQQAYNTSYGQGLAAQGQGFNQAATNAALTNQAAGINNAFNQGTYNANVGAQNAMTSGLFGLGSTALTAYGLSNMNPVTNGTVQNGLYGVGQQNKTPSYFGGTY